MATHLQTWKTNFAISGTGTNNAGGDVQGQIVVYLESQDYTNNTSYISIRHQLVFRRDNGTYVGYHNGLTSSYRANVGSQGGSYQARSFTAVAPQGAFVTGTYTLGTTYHTVSHNVDGTGTLYVNGSISGSFRPFYPQGSSYRSVNRSSSFSKTLPTIPRGTAVNLSVAKRSLTSLSLNWTSTDVIDRLQYSYKKGNGEWTGWQSEISVWGTSGTYNLTGLEPNTQYTVQIRGRRSSTGVYGGSSGHRIQTTYDIARITSIVPSNNIEMGDDIELHFTNPSGEAMQVGIYSNTSPQVPIVQYLDYAGASPYVFELSQEEKEQMYDLSITKPTQEFRLYVNNLNNSYRHDVIKTFKITENETSKPIFTTWTYKDINEITTALTGNNQKVIKGYSNVEATILEANKMITQKNATPSHYTFTIGGISEVIPYTTSKIEKTINNVNNELMTMTAVDSRGFIRGINKDLGSNFIEYTSPIILSSSIERDNNIGAQTKLSFNGVWWNQSFGSQSNTLIAKVYYGNNGDWVFSENVNLTINGDTFSFEGYIKGDLGADGFTADKGFEVKLELIDKLNTLSNVVILPSGKPAIAIHKDGVAIGGTYDEILGGTFQLSGRVWNGPDMYLENGNVYIKLEPTDTEFIPLFVDE